MKDNLGERTVTMNTKNQNAARIIITLLLFVPLIVAIIFALNTDPNTVSANSLKTVSVTDPDGNKFSFPDESDLSLYSSITSSSREVNKDTLDITGLSQKVPFTVTYEENNREPLVLELYVSENAESLVYTTPDGKYFLVDTSVAQQLIVRPEYASVSSSGILPSITVTGIGEPYNVTASKYDWTYKTMSGSFSNASAEITVENPTVKLDISDENLAKFDFSKTPDKFELTVKNGEETLFVGDYSNIKDANMLTFNRDMMLTVTVDAVWEEKEGADYYGSATYKFSALYDVTPSYEIMDKSLPTGEFTVLMMNNFNDGETVEIENSIGLPSSMPVYNYEGKKIILVPLSYNLEEGDYTLTLTNEVGQTGTATGKISRKEEYSSQEFLINDGEDPGLNEALTQTAIDEFNSLIASLSKESADAKLFTGTSFEYPTGASKAVSGGATYGMTRKAISKNAGEITYTSFGQDMECMAGQDIKAANSGKVIYADTTSFLGNTVIVDHGYGILSVYGCLDSISVNVGDDVAKSETVLGKAGSTGFACKASGGIASTSITCHYAVSMNGVFIAPRSIKSGIHLG